jgi:hypothetical protein
MRQGPWQPAKAARWDNKLQAENGIGKSSALNRDKCGSKSLASAFKPLILLTCDLHFRDDVGASRLPHLETRMP